jgi:hypothetical protein
MIQFVVPTGIEVVSPFNDRFQFILGFVQMITVVNHAQRLGTFHLGQTLKIILSKTNA